MPWFDAHLDLAYLVEQGRDMDARAQRCGGALQPAAVTLPSLREGQVTACLGTIFTEAVAPDGVIEGPWAYREGDAQSARAAGMRQLGIYLQWQAAGLIELLPRRGGVAAPGVSLYSPPRDGGGTLGPPRDGGGTLAPPRDGGGTLGPPRDGGGTLAPPRDGGGTQESPRDGGGTQPPLRVGILMECADPIADLEELPWWAERVIAIGMAWARGSRFAGGNATGGGLTDLGRELVRRMDDLGVVHDVSHLSQQALDELLELTDATVIATHSNARALMGEGERHLSDEAIGEITRRGGVVGLNLYSAFLAPGLGEGGRATVDDCIGHIEHICEVAGTRRQVGLGSDMDGGFPADRLPAGIDLPRDLERLAEGLAARGWSEGEVASLRWGAWAGFWGM